MSRARQMRRLARHQRPAPAWAPVPIVVVVARPLDWTLYPGQARASLEVKPIDPSDPWTQDRLDEFVRRLRTAHDRLHMCRRTFDGVELGRMHQAAHDRHQLAWWVSTICPLPGVSLATLLARGRRAGLEHVVRAIIARAGLLPKGSEVAA